MNFYQTTEFIKQWLPWVTVGTIVFRLGSKAKTRITVWMDSVLDNHLTHVQASLEKLEVHAEKQTELLERIANK
jgi:hypothetical protein